MICCRIMLCPDSVSFFTTFLPHLPEIVWPKSARCTPCIVRSQKTRQFFVHALLWNMQKVPS